MSSVISVDISRETETEQYDGASGVLPELVPVVVPVVLPVVCIKKVVY